MILITLLLILAAIIYYAFNSYKKKYNYWKDKGVAQLKNQHIIYGDAKQIILKEKTSGEVLEDFYYEFKKMGAEHGGIYFLSRPQWVPISPAILKLVMAKDFQHFSAHHPKISNTLLFNNMFHMDGEPWKDIRRKLSPTFTSGKMKMMFDMILDKTKGLEELVETIASSGKPVEIKEIMARFTTDVIGTCGFGIECNSLNDVNSVFFQRGQDIFRRLQQKSKPNIFTGILILLGLRSPFNFDLLDVEDFFRNLVKDTVGFREKNKIVRKDFLHMMIQLKNRGTITDILNESDVFQKTVGEDGMSMEDVAGQCMLFYTAGFETSSTTTSFALLELAHNQEIQDKLRKEVREILKKHNGALTYEAVQEMNYCNNVVHETLRKYPPLANLARLCTKEYKIPNTNIIINKGTNLHIPIFALQHDPDYFPQPEKFIPERFNPENKGNIVEYTFMPFGDGPRQCLGLRFGLMQAISGLATLINSYKFTLNTKCSYPPKFSRTSPVLSVEEGIWLNIEKAA